MKSKFTTLFMSTLLLLIAAAVPAWTAELSPAASNGFDRYAELTEAQMNDQIREGQFLWVDTLPADERDDAYARLRKGEILTEKQELKDNGREVETPSAMIHNWISIVFVADVNLQEVKAFFQDYDNMYKYYRPEVVRSKLLSRHDERFKIYIRMVVKKFLTFVANTTQDVRYKQLDSRHLISISDATRIAEVEDAGTPKERELPVGNDRGLLWRSKSYWRAEQKDGGVYVQCETLTLTRDIPLGLGPLVKPFLSSTPRGFLENMMTNVRNGVEKTAKAENSQRSDSG